MSWFKFENYCTIVNGRFHNPQPESLRFGLFPVILNFPSLVCCIGWSFKARVAGHSGVGCLWSFRFGRDPHRGSFQSGSSQPEAARSEQQPSSAVDTTLPPSSFVRTALFLSSPYVACNSPLPSPPLSFLPPSSLSVMHVVSHPVRQSISSNHVNRVSSACDWCVETVCILCFIQLVWLMY